MDSYEKQWQYGVDAFDRQEIITRESQRKYHFAEQKRRSIARQTIEWNIRANRDLGEDPTDFAIREKRRARETFNILSDQQDRSYYETKLSFNHFNFEKQRLMQARTILANFVNKAKNQNDSFRESIPRFQQGRQNTEATLPELHRENENHHRPVPQNTHSRDTET